MFRSSPSLNSTAANNMPTFGQPSVITAPTFGEQSQTQNNLALPSFGSFGAAAAANTTSGFGSSIAFGNTNNNAFGSASPAFNANNANNTQTFGSAGIGAFGATAATSFGASPVPSGFTTPISDEQLPNKINSVGFNSAGSQVNIFY